ncbi:phosphate ABC transporter substrate-binding/OmpA family protein [Runella sp.]|uniref:phosphate ABC transporter substrate-binding/OmpA family protein n=1 Tax=Runella sp. TaxID=1960881 RepID=UPI0026018014|nr:phosphate ABC transporter substrate-binding/OmpA family protein [Runella sp.]
MKLTGAGKVAIIVLLAVAAGALYYYLGPELKIAESKSVSTIDVQNDNVNVTTTSAKLDLPSESASTAGKPLVNISGYAWNAQSGIIAANGGAKTTAGSLMEKNGVNLSLTRQDWLSELRNNQMKFIESFDTGKDIPTEGSAGIMIMGDGAPFYISSTQQALDEKYGKGKYNLKIVGALGKSVGEDKLIGPVAWKLNPQAAKGAYIATVIGDGDWVVAVNWAAINGIKVNPDPNTYDPDALNFKAAKNDDFVEAAKEFITSQKQGLEYELKVVKNGKPTGETIKKKIDGCSTWTPADKMIFDELSGVTDIISTKEFNNQMPCVLIMPDEWCKKHPEVVTGILKSSLEASNQIKQYDEWGKFASGAVAKTFASETPEFWYKMFKGYSETKNGLPINVGGSQVMNLADNKMYFGLKEGESSRYEKVYNQVSNYLKDLNPAGFNDNIKKITTYAEVMNLTYLSGITGIDEGTATTANYDRTASSLVGKGSWQISFATGNSEIMTNSYKTLQTILNLLVEAESGKIEVYGHTDNTGNAAANDALSQERAKAVKAWLKSRGIPENRFQAVQGKGQSDPIEDNDTPEGRAKNRRVEIVIKN